MHLTPSPQAPNKYIRPNLSPSTLLPGTLCILLLLLSQKLYGANEMVFSEHVDVIEAVDNIYYFEDKNSALSVQQAIQLDDKEWSQLPGNIANFGFSKSTYWFTFNIKNSNQREINLYVNIEYPLLDKIDFYTLSNDQIVEQYQSGDIQPFNDRPVEHPTFLFPLSLQQEQSKTILIKVQSEGPIQVPLAIWKQETFLLNTQHYIFLYGCFIAVILIMSAYNLCLYLFVRDTNYLLYTFFTLCMASVKKV